MDGRRAPSIRVRSDLHLPQQRSNAIQWLNDTMDQILEESGFNQEPLQSPTRGNSETPVNNNITPTRRSLRVNSNYSDVSTVSTPNISNNQQDSGITTRNQRERPYVCRVSSNLREIRRQLTPEKIVTPPTPALKILSNNVTPSNGLNVRVNKPVLTNIVENISNHAASKAMITNAGYIQPNEIEGNNVAASSKTKPISESHTNGEGTGTNKIVRAKHENANKQTMNAPQAPTFQQQVVNSPSQKTPTKKPVVAKKKVVTAPRKIKSLASVDKTKTYILVRFNTNLEYKNYVITVKKFGDYSHLEQKSIISDGSDLWKTEVLRNGTEYLMSETATLVYVHPSEYAEEKVDKHILKLKLESVDVEKSIDGKDEVASSDENVPLEVRLVKSMLNSSKSQLNGPERVSPRNTPKPSTSSETQNKVNVSKGGLNTGNKTYNTRNTSRVGSQEVLSPQQKPGPSTSGETQSKISKGERNLTNKTYTTRNSSRVDSQEVLIPEDAPGPSTSSETQNKTAGEVELNSTRNTSMVIGQEVLIPIDIPGPSTSSETQNEVVDEGEGNALRKALRVKFSMKYKYYEVQPVDDPDYIPMITSRGLIWKNFKFTPCSVKLTRFDAVVKKEPVPEIDLLQETLDKIKKQDIFNCPICGCLRPAEAMWISFTLKKLSCTHCFVDTTVPVNEPSVSGLKRVVSDSSLRSKRKRTYVFYDDSDSDSD